MQFVFIIFKDVLDVTDNESYLFISKSIYWSTGQIQYVMRIIRKISLIIVYYNALFLNWINKFNFHNLNNKAC